MKIPSNKKVTLSLSLSLQPEECRKTKTNLDFVARDIVLGSRTPPRTVLHGGPEFECAGGVGKKTRRQMLGGREFGAGTRAATR